LRLCQVHPSSLLWLHLRRSEDTICSPNDGEVSQCVAKLSKQTSCETPVSKARNLDSESVCSFRTLMTISLPNYKHRGTQDSCDAHSKWYPACRIGQSLEGGEAPRADFTGVRARTTTHRRFSRTTRRRQSGQLHPSRLGYGLFVPRRPTFALPRRKVPRAAGQ
jgi:hypothetical protein